MVIVFLACFLGHLQVEDPIKRWITVGLCSLIMVLDQIRFRFPIFSRANAWLVTKRVLRPEEEHAISTATQLAAVIGVPLLFQIPIWILVPAVATFAGGDAFAREIGKRNPYAKKFWKGGDKTWIGFWSYEASGLCIGIGTIVLNQSFPLYPPEYSIRVLLAGVIIMVFLGAFAEVLCEKLPKVFDDNLVVPVVSVIAFCATISLGQ